MPAQPQIDPQKAKAAAEALLDAILKQAPSAPYQGLRELAEAYSFVAGASTTRTGEARSGGAAYVK